MRVIDADGLKVRMFRSNEFNCDTGSFDLPVVPWHDIEDAETLDYAPVKHASWIRQDDTYTRFQCGECKSKNFDRRWVFCPLCGAKMDGGKKDGGL